MEVGRDEEIKRNVMWPNIFLQAGTIVTLEKVTAPSTESTTALD